MTSAMKASMKPATVKSAVMRRSSMEECMGASVPRRRCMQVAREVGCCMPAYALAMKVTTLPAYIVAINDISTV